MISSHNNPRRPRSSTLVGKLLRIILPAVFLAVVVVAGAGYSVARSQIRAGISQQVQGVADLVVSQVHAYRDQRRLDLEALAGSRGLVDYFKWVEYDLMDEAKDERKKLGEYFREFYKRTDVYDLIAYCEPNGKVLAAAEYDEVYPHESHPILTPEAIRLWASTPGVYASPILNIGGVNRFIYAKRDLDSSGKLRGLIVLVCKTEPLLTTLQKTRVGLRGAVHIQDLDTHLTIGQAPPRISGLRAEASDGQWNVIVEASEEEFLGPLVLVRNVTIAMFLLVGALITWLLVLVVRRVTHPINDLVIGTQRLAAGDMNYRFPLPELQDLQSLAVSFNNMADHLRARSAALENRINQLSALRMMEHTVIQGLDEEAILRTTLEAIAKGLGFDRAGLYWVDEPRGLIVGRYSHFNYPTDFTEAEFRKRSLPLGGSDIINHVIATRQVQLVTDPEHHPGVDIRYVKQAGTNEFVMAPMCGQDHVYGVITADNRHTHRPLTESDRDGLMLFASAAGMALENARLMGEVAQSEARHRMVLENSPVAILALSRDHKIVTFNRGAEAMFGYTADQVVGQPLSMLLPPDAVPELDRLVAELVRTGSVREHPMKGRTSQRNLLDITISWGGKNPDFISNDEWAVVIHDVTEARKLQTQLILSEKLTVVGQLISGIAHELNNPLQAVVGYAQLLASRPQPGAAGREIERLYHSAQRCRRIIDNLLVFVRQGEVSKGPVSLRRAIDAAIELLTHKLRRAQVDVHVHTGVADPFVSANFQQLEQVFINLVNNACDVMQDRPDPRRIDIRVETRIGRAFVRVTDTGPGIPLELRARIFEPFFTTKGEGHGTGLGLPLCAQIVEEHGGKLTLVENPDSRGATFLFDLQMCAPPAEPKPHEPAEPTRMPGRKIFVVDDEPEVRSLLQDVLEAQGHQVTTAESLQTAFAAANSSRYDLVVSDVHLNDGIGLDLFRQWDHWADYPRPRFLFLTGDIISPSLEAVCTEWEARVLQKPMDLREFRAAVAWALDAQTPLKSTSA